MKIVIIKHFENSRKYMFEVPTDKDVACGDVVIVNNARGEQTGVCCCDSFEVFGNVLEELKDKYGAGKELKKVVGIMRKEMWVSDKD